MTHALHESGETRPELVVLDVNETLSDLSPLGEVFTDIGLDSSEVGAWFAGVLRDAFALTVLGDNPSFADIGSAWLRVRLAAAGSSDPAGGAREVMDHFANLDPHPDVVPGLKKLAAAKCRLVTLSNGSAAIAESLLGKSGSGCVIEGYLSVEDAGIWKPARRAYAYALSATSVPAGRAMLVAVHPWDIEGARRAGLQTAWINRTGDDYPDHLPRADVEASSLVELAQIIAR